MGLYLYNFLMFVQWPEDSVQGRDILKIGIFGGGGPGNAFCELRGKEIRGRTVVIRDYHSVEDVEPDCDAIFIHNKGRGVVTRVLSRVRGSACLTVSDMASFTRMGGMVSFSGISHDPKAGYAGERQGRVKRFKINLAVVMREGLTIRSRLLRLSEIVGEIPNGRNTRF